MLTNTAIVQHRRCLLTAVAMLLVLGGLLVPDQARAQEQRDLRGALLGWAHLAALVCAGWFVALLCIQTSLVLQGRLSHWSRHAPAREVPALARALALGLGYPAVWLTSTAMLTLWLLRRLGRDDLLWALLHKDLGWGSVSVSVLRILAVVVGFFIVRVALSGVRAAPIARASSRSL